ncbi:MAG: outer membrane lipoprotein carrier protein LolA [Alphaproteobacteria bacterium]|nr:outer membrane lipoprotein carrier protein LolA [Alphaproteobacteria bacterium]
MIGRRLACTGALALLTLPARAQMVELPPGTVLRGKFTQRRYLEGFDRPLESGGVFVLVSGRGLIWRATAPFPMLTVMGAGGLVQQAAGGATSKLDSSKVPFLAKLYQVFAAALAGNVDGLSDVFVVTREARPAGWRVRLRPKPGGGPAMPIRDIVIDGGRFVEQVEVFRATGDKDVVEFSEQATSSGPVDAEEARALSLVERR